MPIVQRLNRALLEALHNDKEKRRIEEIGATLPSAEHKITHHWVGRVLFEMKY